MSVGETFHFQDKEWRIAGYSFDYNCTGLHIDAVPAPWNDAPLNYQKEATPVTNKVEKGQKYKSGMSGITYEILTEPFTVNNSEKAVYRADRRGEVEICDVSAFESMTLIREPKFKVGDRVAYYGRTHDVVSATDKPDSDGDFWYVLDDGNARFECLLESHLKVSSS